jgi:hypothetical protein
VNNNPVRYTDSSGHCYTDSGAWIPAGGDGACSFKTSTSTTVANPYFPTNITNPYFLVESDYAPDITPEEQMNNLAIVTQDIATLFSVTGALFEIGGTVLGAAAGVEGGLPGMVIGGTIGYIVGHEAHVVITNPIESTFSWMSLGATYAHGEMTNPETKDENGNLIVDEATEVSVSMAFIGEFSNSGILDAAIDIYSSCYNHGITDTPIIFPFIPENIFNIFPHNGQTMN